jgi:hypothetical protein
LLAYGFERFDSLLKTACPIPVKQCWGKRDDFAVASLLA